MSMLARSPGPTPLVARRAIYILVLCPVASVCGGPCRDLLVYSRVQQKRQAQPDCTSTDTMMPAFQSTSAIRRG